MTWRPPVSAISRRQLLGGSVPLALAVPAVLRAEPTSQEGGQTAPPFQAKPDHTFNINAATVAPLGTPTPATLVNGTYPGPELRYREGDHLRVLANNQLNVPTTIHWHGMIVPNYMDGVPGVTQMPIAPGRSVIYEYPLRQSGTYWYHSHVGFQEQTGLSGPLIIESRNEPHAYDHDVVVFLQDFLNQAPAGIVPQIRGQQTPTSAVQPPKQGGYPFPADRKFEVDVNYPGYLLNGRSNRDPWTLKVRRGDRIRFRMINGSTASFFRVMLDGHKMQLIAADGQPVEPSEISNLVLATAERYDVLVTVQESGSFTLHAAALGTKDQVVGVVHTADARAQAQLSRPKFDGRSGGLADYASLKAPYPTTIDGPVNQIDVELGGMMKKYLWSMNGEYYPEVYSPDGKAEPLKVRYGQRVRVRLTNKTMMYHPMHLHGHFFRLLPKPGDREATHAPIKDTLAIGPKQEIEFEFLADNPGRWFFHCHNLYHLASGMARVVEYES